MQEVQVKEVARREKGRVFFRFDNGTEFTLYRSEIRGLPQAESNMARASSRDSACFFMECHSFPEVRTEDADPPRSDPPHRG